MEVEIGDYNKDHYQPCSSEYINFGISHSSICHFPEFWQEVVEREYEILSFMGVQGNLATQDENGLFGYLLPHCNKFTCNELLSHFKSTGKIKIHSIKRLSDGEIFTIGDRLIDSSNMNQGSFTLKTIEFEIAPSDKGTGRLTFIHDHKILGKWLYLSGLKHVKEPLFVTEDGVEIHEISDEKSYFQLTPEWYIYEIGNKFYACRECDKYFSTREAAQEYIDLNKPKYSLQDVINSMEGLYACTGCIVEHRLKNFNK